MKSIVKFKKIFAQTLVNVESQPGLSCSRSREKTQTEKIPVDVLRVLVVESLDSLISAPLDLPDFVKAQINSI